MTDSPYVRRVRRIAIGVGVVVTLAAASMTGYYGYKFNESIPEKTPQAVYYQNLRDRVIPELERKKKRINSGIMRTISDMSIDDFTELYSAEIEKIRRLDSTINERRAEMFASANTPGYRSYLSQHDVLDGYANKFMGGIVSTVFALTLSLFGHGFAVKMARRRERYQSQTPRPNF